MRDINLSQENLAVQWQYVKRNLRELGVIANFDDFEQKAHRAIDNLIQKGAENVKSKRCRKASPQIHPQEVLAR